MPRVYRPGNESHPYFTYLSEFQETWEGQVVIEELLITVITVVAFIGNILMLLVTCRQARPLAVVNLLLASQCTSDLLIVLTNPLIIITRATGDWVLGDVPCKLLNYLQYASAATSVWTMTCLSVDRYVAVCSRSAAPSPIRPHVWKVMAGTWVMGLAWFSPFLAGWSTISVRQKDVVYTWCYLIWPEGVHGLTFIMMSGICVIALPLVVIVFCYTRVLVTVRQSTRRITNGTYESRSEQPVSRSGELGARTGEPGSRSGELGSRIGEPGSRSGQTMSRLGDPLSRSGQSMSRSWKQVSSGPRGIRRAVERKLVILLVVLVALFVLMWFPFFAFAVAITMDDNTTSTQYFFFLLLPISNTAINPFLILYFNPNYRQSVVTLLSSYCPRWCCRRCCGCKDDTSDPLSANEVIHSVHVKEISESHA